MVAKKKKKGMANGGLTRKKKGMARGGKVRGRR